MKKKILTIVFILSEIINCNDVYYFFIEKLFSGYSRFKLSLTNKKIDTSDNDIFYSGSGEYIENILFDPYSTRKSDEDIRNEKHPLVFMFNLCFLEYINYFPENTLFIIAPHCINNQNNYPDYTIFTILEGLVNLHNGLISGSYFYIKIGKDIDNSMKIFFYIIIGISILISIFLCFIMKRVLKNMDENNLLLTNFLICHISDLLLVAIIGNCLSFFFFMGQSIDSYLQYLILFLIGLYKSGFYTLAILLLKGWMIITFDDLTSRFQVYFKRLLLYELLVSLFISLSMYFFHFSNKLNLFYIKSEIEQIVFIFFLVYCIFKKLMPLYRQMKYEESIQSELIESLRFKYKLLFKIYIIFEVHAIWIIISPLIEMELIYAYLYNDQSNLFFIYFMKDVFVLH